MHLRLLTSHSLLYLLSVWLKYQYCVLFSVKASLNVLVPFHNWWILRVFDIWMLFTILSKPSNYTVLTIHSVLPRRLIFYRFSLFVILMLFFTFLAIISHLYSSNPWHSSQTSILQSNYFLWYPFSFFLMDDNTHILSFFEITI